MQTLWIYGARLGVLFTAITAISSTVQLIKGTEMDSNAHILLRLAICVIAIGVWILFSRIKFKRTSITLVVQYTISTALVLATIFLLGFVVELASSAYRDIFLNYTVMFWVIAGIITLIRHKQSR